MKANGSGWTVFAIRFGTLPAVCTPLSPRTEPAFPAVIGPRIPLHDDLARFAGARGGERGFVLAEREAVGDRRADVQPRLEHHGHLVPGLVHLPAVDALHGEHLEH